MPGPSVDMSLRGGLASDRVERLAGLVSDITGLAVHDLPALAPVLLFSDPAVQAQLPMPQARDDEIVAQDAQSIAYATTFPLDTDLAATAIAHHRDNFVEFRFALSGTEGPVAHLVTALRLVRVTDLSAVKATTFRPASLGDNVQWSSPIAVSQDRTNRYLTLSGDRNPIHRDPARAQRLGLPAPIVPGLLLASLIQPFVEAALPDSTPISLNSRFLAPLCMQAPLRIGVQLRESAVGGIRKARAYSIDGTDRALAIIDLQLRVAPG